jgi:hypothetical protein
MMMGVLHCSSAYSCGAGLGVSSEIIALHQENFISCEKRIAVSHSTTRKPD